MQKTVRLNDKGENGKPIELTLEDSVGAIVKYKKLFGKSIFAPIAKDSDPEDNLEKVLGIAYVFTKNLERKSFEDFCELIHFQDIEPLSAAVSCLMNEMQKDSADKSSKN